MVRGRQGRARPHRHERPHADRRAAAHAAARPRWPRSMTSIDVQASNVPGYPVPVYIDGIKVLRTFGFGPVPGVAAMITMTTMAGRCEVARQLRHRRVHRRRALRPLPARGLRRGHLPAEANEEARLMVDPDSIDFFRSDEVVADPYSYLRAPGAVPGRPEPHHDVRDGDRLRGSARRVPRHGDVLVVQLGDRSVPGVPRAARGRRRQRAHRASPRRAADERPAARRSIRRSTPTTATC